MDNDVAVRTTGTAICHLGPPLAGSSPDYQGHSVTVQYSRPRSRMPPVLETTSDMSLAARMALPADGGQPRTGASQTTSTATGADCRPTEPTATRFLCEINGAGRTVEPQPHLTAEPEFRHNCCSHFSNAIDQLSRRVQRMTITRDEEDPIDNEEDPIDINNVALSIAQTPCCHRGPPLVGSAPDYQGPAVTVQRSDHRSPAPPVFGTTNDMSLAMPPDAGQSRTGASQTASTATDADCRATESTAPHFSCQINGVGRTFESLLLLVAEPELLENFRRNFSLYLSDDVALLSDYELQGMIITRAEVKRAFLRCNHVQQTTQTSVDSKSGSQAEPLFNPLMNTYGKRLISMTLHDAARQSLIFHRLPGRVGNIMSMSEEGFYLSYAQLKLFCFSCGGALERWNREWQNYSIREVHARVFPSCRFVCQQFGASFINDCRQKVAPGAHNDGPDPLATHPHLYRLPVTEEELHHEFTLRAQLRWVFRYSLPLRVMSRSPSDQEQSALAEMDRQVQQCLVRLDQMLNDPLAQLSLSKLHTRVGATRTGSVDMMATMLKILQDLLDMPGERLPAVVGEVTQIIDAILEHDCQDHTSEVLDQITTRMAFVSIHQKMAQDSSLTVLDLFEQLKLLFNETVLYQLLTKNKMHGIPLIAHPESVEIRAFLKNEFARTVCDFHSNTIHQVHPCIGAQSESRRLELTESFKEGISNREHFKSYLLKLFKTDTSFVNFLKLHDEDFATMLGTTESSAELLMELYSSGNSSEQEVLTNTSNLAATREEFLLQDLEYFLGEYVRHYWEAIVSATSR